MATYYLQSHVMMLFVLSIRFLKCEPFVIDSHNVSPQARRRFFWTNLPGVTHSTSMSDEVEGPTLDSCLDKNLGRRANVSKVRTITTKRSCLQESNYYGCMIFICHCHCHVLIIEF